MSDQHSSSHGSSNPHVRYEPTDIASSPILRSGIYLAIATLIVVALLWAFFGFMTRREAAAQPPPPAMRFPADRKPPLPNLLTDEPAMLHSLLADEDATLHTYGYIDAEKGIVRIPIDRAIQIVAARGLPSRVPAAATPPSATPVPTVSPTAGVRH